jgi:flagellar basal-body rod protein FlgB
MFDRINEALDFHAKVLVLRAERQKVIATNIANADTPEYKAVDVNFADALRAAAGTPSSASGGRGAGEPGVRSAGEPARTHAGHIAAGGAGGAGMAAPLLYRTPPQAAMDNNTVDLDLERAQFAENAVRYEATLRFINGQIRTLTSAISGNTQ